MQKSPSPAPKFRPHLLRTPHQNLISHFSTSIFVPLLPHRRHQSYKQASMSSPSTHRINAKYHTPLRSRIISMYNDAGIAKAKIATKLQIPRTSVNDVLKGAPRRPPTTRTRPSILSDSEVDLMIKTATGSFKDRIYTWKGLAVAIGREDVSQDTVRRYMHARGMKKCKACHHPFISAACAIKRLHWVNTEERWRQELEYWMNWAWSDEVTFTTGMQGTKYVIRTSGDRHNPDCSQNQFRSGRVSFSC